MTVFLLPIFQLFNAIENSVTVNSVNSVIQISLLVCILLKAREIPAFEG